MKSSKPRKLMRSLLRPPINRSSLALWGILLFFTTHYTSLNAALPDPRHAILFDDRGNPAAKLSELLHLLGMPPLNGSEQALTQMNRWAQNHLLRKGERWDQQCEDFEALSSEILPFLNDLAFTSKVLPRFDRYDGAIVHGGTLSHSKRRIDELLETWERGVRFKTLYFLSGERPLIDNEKQQIISEAEKMPTTECEMLEHLWRHASVPLELQHDVAVYFINAPMKASPTSKLLRPTTEDTVNVWLASSPLKGRYLCFSNAPYILRQDLIVKTIAPSSYSFDTVGPAASEQQKIVILLDELARLIYQIHHSKSLSGSHSLQTEGDQ